MSLGDKSLRTFRLFLFQHNGFWNRIWTKDALSNVKEFAPRESIDWLFILNISSMKID
jgi:hypothetical protein